MNKTLIQWCDVTWNPLLGCRRCSPGCKNCYAERLIAFRMSKNPRLPMYHDIARKTAHGEPQFTGARRLVPDRLDEPLRARKGQHVFVCDMGDLFYEGHPFEDIAAVYGVMASARQHAFLVLTKRPERALEFYAWIKDQGAELQAAVGEIPGPKTSTEGSACIALLSEHIDLSDRVAIDAYNNAPWPLLNVHVGVSVEDQASADKRIPLLLRIPAPVRFLSVEPMLEEIDLRKHLAILDTSGLSDDPLAAHLLSEMARKGLGDGPRAISQVICGGESGPNARPFDLAWARSLRDQCRAAAVPFFMKQLGALPRIEIHVATKEEREAYRREHPRKKGTLLGSETYLRLKDSHGGNMAEWPEDLRIREYPQ